MVRVPPPCHFPVLIGSGLHDDPLGDLERLFQSFNRSVDGWAEISTVLEIDVGIHVEVFGLLESIEVPEAAIGDVRSELPQPLDVGA